MNPEFSAAGLNGPGSYTVSLKVTDEFGAFHVDSTTISILNVAPTVTLTGPTTANAGQTKHYTFTATDPGTDTFSIVATSGDSVGAVTNQRFGPFAAPVAGIAFGFGWTPCIGPVLTSVLAFAAGSGETWPWGRDARRLLRRSGGAVPRRRARAGPGRRGLRRRQAALLRHHRDVGASCSRRSASCSPSTGCPSSPPPPSPSCPASASVACSGSAESKGTPMATTRRMTRAEQVEAWKAKQEAAKAREERQRKARIAA